ncbi:MAG: PAS domain-containing protein [Candidatus Marinimicrobia bacterium]|nr:PAS domain-containing protein [Candidatus Neomarinimicrobiota bacterium]
MFLISKFRVYLFFLFAVLTILFIGIHGYLSFSEIEVGNVLSMKYLAENFIYYVIVLLIVLTIIFVSMLVKSKNIFKELEKVIELSRQGKYSSGMQLKKLGRLGDKVIEINTHLNSLNEMKSLKISSMSNIVNFLLDKAEAPMLLLDAQGMIIKVSRYLLEQMEISEKDLINKYAENIFDKFLYSSVMIELRKSKYITLQSPLMIDSFEKPIDVNIVAFPIINYKNEISNCICTIITKEELSRYEVVIQEVKPSTDPLKIPTELQERPLFKRFKDIFRQQER